MSDDVDPRVADAQTIITWCELALHKTPPEIVMAVLIDLLSKFVAGHFADGPAKTAEVREELLAKMLDHARQGIPLHEKAALASVREGSH